MAEGVPGAPPGASTVIVTNSDFVTFLDSLE